MGRRILVDAPQEILANKLGALLHRAELRDVIDLRALLATGLDLGRGLDDAARKDLGFSPLMVAHLLQDFPVACLGAALGTDAAQVEELTNFCRDLARQIAGQAQQ